jgi:hypothetical protein
MLLRLRRGGKVRRIVSEPTIIKKRAIDVTPYNHGIYCTINGGEPFVNEIATRGWTRCGAQIQVMFESHNFAQWDPDALVDVVEIESGVSPKMLAEFLAEDAEKMAKRPHAQRWHLLERSEYPGLISNAENGVNGEELNRLLLATEIGTLEQLLASLSPTDSRPVRVVLAEEIVRLRAKAGAL